jgi:membrane protein
MLRRVREAFDPDGGGRLGLGARTVQRYVADGMAERAPALAYYGIFSLFPALMLAFTVTRFLAGDGAPADVAEYSRDHGASGAVAGALRSAVQTTQAASVPTAGSAGVISLLTLVYGASRAFTAIGRAQDIGWTLVLLAMGIIALLLVSVSGRVLEDLLGLVGIDGTDPTIWSVVRWPVAACIALIGVDLVRWTAPTGERGPFRLMTAGRFVTVAALVTATVGYNVYITHIASYNATYGAFAAAIILMLWIWLAGSVLLLGAELDAVLDEPTGGRSAGQPSTSPTSRARATASERDEASSLR